LSGGLPAGGAGVCSETAAQFGQYQLPWDPLTSDPQRVHVWVVYSGGVATALPRRTRRSRDGSSAAAPAAVSAGPLTAGTLGGGTSAARTVCHRRSPL